ncbi:MAG: hypothetical protein V9E93_00785 [Steroidobacteraceae bacterium]
MHQQLPSIGPIHGQLAGPASPDRHELAEEMAWVHLYRAVRQPPGAAEVVKYLNSNPEARSRHEALYLIACETLHAKALADEQSERTVAAFRAIFVTAPISVLQLAMAIVVAIPRIFTRAIHRRTEGFQAQGRRLACQGTRGSAREASGGRRGAHRVRRIAEHGACDSGSASCPRGSRLTRRPGSVTPRCR